MKILIVGGGIAGLNCALRLLRRGFEVTVVERRRGPLDKVCGEGVLPFGAALLSELGLLESVCRAGAKFGGVSYHAEGRRADGRFQDGAFGVGVERKALDAVFRNACALFPKFSLKEGVAVKPGPIEGYDRVVAADGVCSRWGDYGAGSARRSCRLGVRFRLAAPAEPRVNVHFFKGFEVYLTPVGETEVSVAMLIDPDRLGISGGQLKPWSLAFFRDAFPQFAGAPVRDFATRGPIAARRSGRAPSIHLLGDAWRAFDPISGAGMSFALLCGKLAAERIDDPAAYYRDLAPAMRAVDDVTNALLFFRGGGWRTRLMLRQLQKSGSAFDRVLGLHDGRRRIWQLDGRAMWAVLRPW